MPEEYRANDQVAALFHRRGSLYIPPFEVPKERREGREDYEHAFYRLCARQGIIGYADTNSHFNVVDEHGNTIRARVMQPRNGELDNENIEFFVPFADVRRHLMGENGMGLQNPTDRRLVLSARTLLLSKPEPSTQRAKGAIITELRTNIWEGDIDISNHQPELQ